MHHNLPSLYRLLVVDKVTCKIVLILLLYLLLHLSMLLLLLLPFLRLLKDERFASLPMLLETPKTGPLRPSDISADPLDLQNLALLRALRDGN